MQCFVVISPPIQQTTSEQYLEDKKEDYQDCPVLYCLRFVIVPTTNQKQTYVSSSCRWTGVGWLAFTVLLLYREGKGNSSSSLDPLPSARQRPGYGDFLEVKREYYQNCSVLDCVTQCSQSAAHLCEQFLQSNRLGLSHSNPYAVHGGGCLELYYCNMQNVRQQRTNYRMLWNSKADKLANTM